MIQYREQLDIRPEIETSVPYLRHMNYSSRSAWAIERSSFLAFSGGLGQDAIQPTPAACNTTKCTFEPYSSLGVCVKIKDITSHLTVAKMTNSTSADWAMGAKLEYVTYYPVPNSSTAVSVRIMIKTSNR